MPARYKLHLVAQFVGGGWPTNNECLACQGWTSHCDLSLARRFTNAGLGSQTAAHRGWNKQSPSNHLGPEER